MQDSDTWETENKCGEYCDCPKFTALKQAWRENPGRAW